MSLFAKKGNTKLYVTEENIIVDGVIENGSFFEVKSTLSHGDYFKYQKAIMGGMKVSTDGKSDMDGGILLDAEEKLLDLSLTSIYDAEDGNTIKKITPEIVAALDAKVVRNLTAKLRELYKLNEQGSEEEKK